MSSYALTYDDYLYDNLNRLMSVSERNAAGAVQLTQSYSYDRWGNRTINQAGTTQTAGINSRVFEVEATTNRLYAQGDAGRAAEQKWMRYDAGGHLTWDQYTGNGTRVYDAEGRIVQATDSSGNTARYEYNGRGQRVRRVTGGVEWRMVYGVSGELIAEFMASSPLTPSQEYVYRGGQLLVTVKREASSGARSPKWMVQDHLGTPRMIADETGSLVGISRHDYLPYGEELTTQSGRSTSQGYGVPDGVRQKFGGGHERDDETGLDFMQARYYGSAMGRFTSTDPFEPVMQYRGGYNFTRYLCQPQHWNRYTYALNSPVKYVDRNGEIPTIVVGAAAGAVVGGGFELTKQLLSGKPINWQRVAAKTVAGAITGAVAGATGGANLAVQAFAGVSAGVGAGVIDRAIDGDNESTSFNSLDMLTDGLAGATGFAVAQRFKFGDLAKEQFQISAFYQGRNRVANDALRRVRHRSPSRQQGALELFDRLDTYGEAAKRFGDALSDKGVEQYADWAKPFFPDHAQGRCTTVPAPCGKLIIVDDDGYVY